MSMVSVVLDDVTDLEADWVRSGTGFFITALSGNREEPMRDRVCILLTDEQVAELRHALGRAKPAAWQ